ARCCPSRSGRERCGEGRQDHARPPLLHHHCLEGSGGRGSVAQMDPRALVQNRKQLRLRSFVLAAWPSCRGPRQPAANELGGGPVRHVLSPSSNAWPARRRQARPRHIPHPTSLRALHRVPSSVVLRAHLPRPHSVEASGSAFPIKTGSAFPIGIKTRLFKGTSRGSRGFHHVGLPSCIVGT